FIAAKFGRIVRNDSIWVLARLTRRDVKLPAMPRTSHNLALKGSLSQWATSMQASVADRVERAPYVCQSYGFAIHLDFPNVSGCNVRSLRCAHKCHACSSCN